ncbi:MAG: ABC transporter ATP-binding protein, partial [Eubacteriales bacterium]
MLRIEHYTKRFGDKVAVNDLNLHIEAGEIYGFIGHNGAGKTTTLKACAGILAPDEGDIYVNGISVRENPLSVKKIIAYLPDNPELYPFLSGIKYLHFIADVFGIPTEVRNDRIASLANEFQLTDALAQPVSTYSHGMKQRLALIAAFLHEPRLILMDEPFVGLDPQASPLLKTMMR